MPPEFDSWLQVVDSKEEKIATTNGSSQLNQALTAFGVELGVPFTWRGRIRSARETLRKKVFGPDGAMRMFYIWLLGDSKTPLVVGYFIQIMIFMTHNILPKFVTITISLVLLVFSFSGFLRYYLSGVGLEFGIYTPTFFIVLLICARSIDFFLQMRMSKINLLLLLLFSYSLFFGIMNSGNYYRVIIGIYVLLPLMFGLLYFKYVVSNIIYLNNLMGIIWIISVIGIIFDSYTDLPWQGLTYSIGDFQIEGNRDWTTFGIERLSGFARSSYDAGAVLLISLLFISFKLKSKSLIFLLWITTAYCIYLTTSKGLIISFIFCAISSIFSIYKKNYIINMIFGFFVSLNILLPVASVLPYDIILFGNDFESDFFLQSIGLRFTQMWPDAFYHVNSIGTLFIGGGMGTIGVPLDYFDGNFRNSADNLFVYMYCLFGLLSLVLMYLIFRASHFLLYAATYIDKKYFILYQVLLVIITYGVTTNILESTILGFFTGVCVSTGIFLSRKRFPK